ncbi:hypothetical protein DF268_12305 [Streptomyces sp. V2]|nr:hypothetical protein DF268_12305 [Streptomyces sp. V2]
MGRRGGGVLGRRGSGSARRWAGGPQGLKAARGASRLRAWAAKASELGRASGAGGECLRAAAGGIHRPRAEPASGEA